MQYETKELGDFVPCQRDPFCVAFVFPRIGDPIVLKGMAEEVRVHILDYYPVCLQHVTYWKNGEPCGHWSFKGICIYISRKTVQGRKRYCFSMTSPGSYLENFLITRNMPKKWLPIYNLAVVLPR